MNRADDHITFEPEDESNEIAGAKDKIAALRRTLQECKKERDEYLDGWQRAKADGINIRRRALVDAERASKESLERFARNILPVLDSFEMAMDNETWGSVDETWRTGMEGIYAQLNGAMVKSGLAPFGSAGETFDPALHEAVGEIEGAGNSGSIARVMRKGWMLGDTLVRPAQVLLFR